MKASKSPEAKASAREIGSVAIEASNSTKGPVPGTIDPGIAEAVSILQQSGVETFESCEGADGHAFPEPTIRFYGTPAAGPRALAVCMDHGLPVLALRRVWYMENHELTGPNWELTFMTDRAA
jgi:hypothetical protein